MHRIAILGEFTPAFKPHLATNAAIRHSRDALEIAIEGDWISTADIGMPLFQSYSGVWVAPGSPYKNLDLTLWAIQKARENGVPCFGTCGGFQHMILEYARNVLNWQWPRSSGKLSGGSDPIESGCQTL
jgi:CTP synthase (UTP-ammonia lyase)